MSLSGKKKTLQCNIELYISSFVTFIFKDFAYVHIHMGLPNLDSYISQNDGRIQFVLEKQKLKTKKMMEGTITCSSTSIQT